MAVRPRMRRNLANTVKPLAVRQRVYHVYDDGVKGELNKSKIMVQSEDGNTVRTVKLSPQQAQYWIDQGIIGEKPMRELDGEGGEAARQVLGRGKPHRPEGKKGGGREPAKEHRETGRKGAEGAAR